jgi:hypothetical protein
MKLSLSGLLATAAVWILRVGAIIAVLYSLYLIAGQKFWIGPLGGTSPFSIGSASIIYVLAQNQFQRDRGNKVDSIVLGALFANAFLQTYEIIFHFTFPLYSLQYPFVQGVDVKFFIVEVSMLLPLLLMRRDLSFKKTGVYTLGLFFASMLVWVLFGFPQYYAEGYFYTPVLHTDDPYHLALAFNYGSKLILAAFFATLLKLRKPGKTAIWGRKLKALPPEGAPPSTQLPL